MSNALLVMDIINDIAHKNGKVGKDGFYKQAQKRNVIANTKKTIRHARKLGFHIIYVVIGFSEDYKEWTKQSKPFRNVKKEKQVIFDTWGTRVCEEIKPQKGDLIIKKNRIDPFYNTNLEVILKSLNVTKLYLSGISTDMVVLSTVLSGHDRDFEICTIEDCTSASNEKSHKSAINIIRNISEIINYNKFIQGEK